MSDPLNRPNPELEKALDGVHDIAQLRDTLLNTLAKQGQLTITRDSDFNTHLQVRQPEPPQPRLEERDTRPINAERVLYLSGNSRIVITSADGESDLDAIETKLRASLGSRR